jgi:hypothetical protein
MSHAPARVLPLLLTTVLAIGFAAPAEARADHRRVHDRTTTTIAAEPGGGRVRHVSELPVGDATRARLRAERTLKAKLTVPTSVDVGATAVFKTKGSRATRGLRSIKISFGDGATTKGAKLSIVRKHAYAKAGIYLAKLVVKDRTGKKAVAKKNVLVTETASTENGFGAAPPDPAQEVSVDSDTAPGAGAGSPAAVDLRGSTVPVQHQGSLNSCVSWTTAYALMGWYYRQKYAQSVAFAPMYVYSQTYRGIAANGQPNGSYASDALTVLQTQGVDTASHYGAGWNTAWNVPPNSSQRANAANYRISGWDTIFRHGTNMNGASVGTTATEVEALKQRLAANNPVAIAFRVRTDFGSYNNGWYNGNGALTGTLHEMLAVGYDANGLYIQNSWGTATGVNGYVYMTWAAVQRDLYEATFAHGLVTPNSGGGDGTKPTITSFAKRFGTGFVANNAQAPMTFSWAGTDNVGVSKYVLYYRTGSSDWYELAINDTQTSATFNLSFNNSYEFAVAAYDAAGNLSNWALSGLFTPANYQENVASYTGSWFSYDSASFMNGRLYESSQANAYMEVQVNSTTNFGLVSSRYPTGGRAFVYLDGVYQFTIDAYGASASYREVIAWMNFGSPSTHTIRVVVEGTAGRPYFDVDSILVS